jgi:hypothetical protein
MTLNTEININAKPERIWSILIDFENYQNWNPFIKYVKGNVIVGNRIEIFIKPHNSNGMKFKPEILVNDKEKEIKWIGRFLIPGLFDGEHSLKLISNENDTTTFIQSEEFSGILVPLLKNSLLTNTKKGFENMNIKLKELSERK